MSDEKSPLEQAIDQAMDAFVYAPIGLLLDGPELFPKLAERGRMQVKTARMLGQFAVQQGQTEAGKRLSTVDGPLREVLTAFGVVPAPAPAPARAPAPAVTDDAAVPAETAAPARPAKRPAPRKKAPRAASAGPAPTSSGLGIPDYDSLSASQVVKRLQGMPEGELDAVKAYEAATRARKTILNRITQLQKG